jgi:hypothetical protein
MVKGTDGSWKSRTDDDDDVVVLDNDAIEILLLEDLIEAAQQLEGTDSAFDIGFATKRLHGDLSSPTVDGKIGLYQKYRSEHPTLSKKATATYSRGPRWGFRQ